MSSESGQGGLLNALTSITISYRVWTLGDKISAMLKNVATKNKMAKSFGGFVHLSKEWFPEFGPIKKCSYNGNVIWAVSFGILKISQSL